MTKTTDQFEPDNPQKTLDSIHKFKRIGLQRGIPPLWFGITMSVLGGVSVTLAGLDYPRLYLVALAVVIFLLVLYQTLKQDAIAKPLYSGRTLIVIMVIGAIILLPLVLFAQANLDTFGRWLAVATGAGLAIIGSIVSVIERQKHLARIDIEKC